MSAFAGKKVLFKGPLQPGSGYGNDGIDFSRELLSVKADLHLEPTTVGIPIPPEIAELFVKPRAPHFDVAINHTFPSDIGFPPGMGKHASLTVGWTMWEFLGFGQDTESISHLRQRLENFDLLLAYDEVSKQALSEYFEDGSRLKILQGGYNADFWRPKGEEVGSRDWSGTFRFGMLGALTQRKNPFAAIYAFKKLKDEHGDAFDAELHLKNNAQTLHPAMEEWCPGLKLYFEGWSPARIKQFYFSLNCLLAPSWGEGKNLPALEAQTTGCPVIASKIGGHLQWGSEDYCYFVDGPIEEHSEGQGSMRVDVDQLAEKMWHVYNNRGEARKKGRMAANTIPAMCDWEVVTERLGHMLSKVIPQPRKF